MKKIVSILLSVSMLLSLAIGFETSFQATYGLPNSVFVQQQVSGEYGTCTLASTAMMMRARAYLSGNKEWSSITESSIKSKAWSSGGLKWSFTYALTGISISISHTSTNGITIATLKSLINAHPEGIVMYSTKSGGMYHAVLITDYEGDTFYCADPAPGYSGKRIALKDSQLGKHYNGQSGVLSTTTAYWYVSSYSIEKNTTIDSVPTVKATQCVSDGDYHIVTALNNSYGLNIAYNSTAACANVQLQNNMGDDNLTSLVTVKHIGSGYYTMTFKNSGKNLDVYNANKTSGTNVWQYDANNNDAQKWIIAPTGDGYFYIITKLNTNLYLDVSGGKAASATNIQVYNGNNSNAQKWKFIASGKPTESTAKSIKDGEYTISTALSSYAGLNIDGGKTDNGANIHLWNNMNVSTNNAIVTVKHLGNGLSSIVFKKSNKALDADSTKNTSGANVQQWSYAGNRNQKWIIKSAGNGYYYIISHSSGLALDAYNAKSSNGTNVAVHLWNKSNAQKWKFNPVKTRITYDPNGGKLYDDTISSTKFSASNSAREAGKIIIYTSNFASKTTTNQYGDEFSFDKDGKKVGFRAYGSTTGLDIPSGGFVVSKHAESKFDLYNVGRKAQYALCDFNAYTIYFFNNEHDYKIASKLLINGSAYGILPTPIKDGYTFDGWFTSANGGEIITSTSVFNGTSKLYAHWTKVDEEPSTTEEATIPITTVPVTEPATDKPAEPTVKPTEPAEITDSVEPTTTQETPVESQPVQTDPVEFEEPKTEPIDPVEFEGDFTYNTKIINYGEITKYIGQTYQLNKDFFKSGRNSEVEITNNKVLTVNSAGKVTFKKAGYTSLYLRYIKDGGDVNAYYDFVVKKPTLNTTKVSLKIGKSFKLRITGKVGKAVFKSNKKRIITVTKSGKIKAKRRGKATITIRTNGNIKLKCKVTVK